MQEIDYDASIRKEIKSELVMLETKYFITLLLGCVPVENLVFYTKFPSLHSLECAFKDKLGSNPTFPKSYFSNWNIYLYRLDRIPKTP